MVYRKAKQVSSITYNLFTIAKKMVPRALNPWHIRPCRVNARLVEDRAYSNIIRLMSSLFGSRWIFVNASTVARLLSPAAYLADSSARFIDIEPEVWGNFLGKWKDTHE